MGEFVYTKIGTVYWLGPEFTSFVTYFWCYMVWQYVIFASKAVLFLVENQSNNQIAIEATI